MSGYQANSKALAHQNYLPKPVGLSECRFIALSMYKGINLNLLWIYIKPELHTSLPIPCRTEALAVCTSHAWIPWVR